MKALLLLSCAGTLAAQQYTISTLAGGAPPVTPAPAAQAKFWINTGFSASGQNLYFSASNVVFKVDATGTLTRLAGNSRWGTSTSGTAASNGQFSTAGAVVMDALGNLYVADSNYASDSTTNQLIWKITLDGTMHQAVSGLNSPRMAVDAQNNVYFTDGSQVGKLGADGSVSLFAGNGSTTYGADGPAIASGLGILTAIAVDGAGNVYLAAYEVDDHGNDFYATVREITTDGMIHRIAGLQRNGYSGDGGQALSAHMGGYLSGLAVDNAGDIFIADTNNHVIRKITPDGIINSLQSQNQSECNLTGAGPYLCARDVAVDSTGRVYLVGQSSGTLQLLGSNETLTTITGGGTGTANEGDGGPAANAPLVYPTGIAVDTQRNVYIGEADSNRIRKVTLGGTISTVAGNGETRAMGGPVPEGVPAVSAPLGCYGGACKGIAIDNSGNLYFAEFDRVRMVSSTGILTTLVPLAQFFNNVGGIATDGTNLYLPMLVAGEIVKRSPDGTMTVIAGTGTFGHTGDGGPATSATLFAPADVAMDGAGNLYVAEIYQSTIRKITPAGTISTIAGGGTGSGSGVAATSVALSENLGVGADHAGNVYIAEFDFNRLRKVTPDGTITTIAGGACQLRPSNPCAGYMGDGGPATGAQLWGPARVAIDTNGTVYFSDTSNNAVRMLKPAQ